MIKNRPMIDSFESSLVRRNAADYRRNFQIFVALYQEACALGVFPLKDPLDGIDSDIHLARIMNVRKSADRVIMES
jgi:hypothetical protein